MKKSLLIPNGRYRPRFLELDYSHPLSPDWATVAGAFGSSRIGKSFSKKYPEPGILAGSDATYSSKGWNLVGTSGSDAAVQSRLDYPGVGRTDDHSFTWAVWCIPSSSSQTHAWALAKGGNTGSQYPTIALGFRSSTVTRFNIAWDGIPQHSGFNGHVNWDEPVCVFLRYDHVSDILYLDGFNLLRNIAQISVNFTGKSWPATVHNDIQIGAFRRNSTPLYYFSMDGSLDRAMIWESFLDDSVLQKIAFNPNQFFKIPQAFIPGQIISASGRIMSSLTNYGGLAGLGGIAGSGGGLAG